MAAFAKSMFSIALLLAERDPVYEDVASKFWEHFIYIANAMNSQTDPQKSLWDEQDGFFYDYLISAKHERIPVRAPHHGRLRPDVWRIRQCGPIRSNGFLISSVAAGGSSNIGADLVESVGPMVVPGSNNNLILGLVRPDQLRRMLAYMLDENEFLLALRCAGRLSLPPGSPLGPQPGRPRVPVGLRAGRIQNQPLWRQFQLARSHLDAGQLSHPPRAEAVSFVLRR